ncbi:MAG TPA: class I SAM-dependent methyltransferase [Solirubrobacteraceae bacterium]|nr:class I SAM-dependent methyltransferase [Solirubrobacteraceae bacterium]
MAGPHASGSEPFDGLGGTLYDLYIRARPIANVVGRVAWGLDGRLMYRHMERAVRSVAASRRVLYVPCGGGLELRWLGPNDPARVIAVDGAEHMVRRTRRYAQRRGLERVEAVQADVTSLPLEDASVDAVLLYNGLHHFSDPAAAVAEVARCCAPGAAVHGGTFVLGEGARWDRNLRRTRRAGSMGPAGTREDARGWFGAAGLRLHGEQLSGCFWMFEASRGPAR